MSTLSFSYDQAQYEQIPCDLCGSREYRVLAKKDRNRLKVQTCMCTHCALIYINPRMTREWYGRYYEKEYREQMARFRGAINPQSDEKDLSKLFKVATRHGLALAPIVQPHIRQGLTLEVGSGVGGVLNGFKQALNVEVFGVDPSPSEADFASKQGIPTRAALIENLTDEVPLADNILCAQSLNHLLSPRYFMRWAYDHLNPQGCLILEVMNFRHVFRNFRCLHRAIQIDHTYMFVPEVLHNLVKAAGFDVLWMEQDEDINRELRFDRINAGLPGYHMRLVARKSARPPFANLPEMNGIYERTLHSIQAIPDSPWRYFLRYEMKYMLRRLKARLRTRTQPL